MTVQTGSFQKYLVPVAVLMMLSLSYGVITAARSYATNTSQYPSRTFSVTGEGKAVVVPDIGEFRYSVLTEGGTNIATLQKENTDKINKTIAYLKSKSIDAKDIKTAGYNMNPRYEYGTCDKGVCPAPRIVGYTINQDVTVKVRKFDTVGEILSGVIDNGANTVSELAFTIDDKVKVQNEARAEAIKMAQEKAKGVASAAGIRLGKMVSIYEDSGNTPMPYYGMGGAERAQSGGGSAIDMKSPVAAPAPAIEPGSTEVRVNVNITYEIK